MPFVSISKGIHVFLNDNHKTEPYIIFKEQNRRDFLLSARYFASETCIDNFKAYTVISKKDYDIWSEKKKCKSCKK